jgi:hypothetical protein
VIQDVRAIILVDAFKFPVRTFYRLEFICANRVISAKLNDSRSKTGRELEIRIGFQMNDRSEEDKLKRT